MNSPSPKTVGQPLTEREAEVLWHVAEGLSNKTIADLLHLSEHTIKFHLGNIMKKMGTSSRTKAAVTFVQQQGPLRNVQEDESFAGRQNWISGFAAALAHVHRHGGGSDAICEAARNVGMTLAAARGAGVSTFDIEDLKRAQVP